MNSSGAELRGRALHPGTAVGHVLRLDTPVSFWGGVGATGEIIDVRHPQCGQSVSGKVVVMTSGRGSSSATAVLAEQIRAGTAPAGLVLAECDTILVIGALVAAELYGVQMPIVQLSAADLELVVPGTARIRTDPSTLDATVSMDRSR